MVKPTRWLPAGRGQVTVDTPDGQAVVLATEVPVEYAVHTPLADGAPGPKIGTVRRDRHTVRTAYKGARHGYDTTHTCWSGQFEALAYRRLRCYPTRAKVVALMLQEVQRGPA